MKKTCRPNRPTWDHGQKTVSAAGTAEQLPDLVIPDGLAYLKVGLFKAYEDNTTGSSILTISK